MSRIWIKDTPQQIGQTVTVAGWVHNRRDHGKLIFIDLRDRSGLLQVVFTPKDEFYPQAEKLRSEWVIELTGVVAQRPEKMVNPQLATGLIELQPQTLQVLNESV